MRVLVCVCVCVCVCVYVRARGLRIVAAEKILHFINTLIIIIKLSRKIMSGGLCPIGFCLVGLCPVG